MSTTHASEQALLSAIEAGEDFDPAALQALFDRLPGVDADFLMGEWKGGVFTYDHPMGRLLAKVSWYGKRFESVDAVEPFLLNSESGPPEPFDKVGKARLRDVAFRGVLSTAMVYDQQPIVDHFRRVSPDVMLVVGEEKGKPADYFFHLTRVR